MKRTNIQKAIESQRERLDQMAVSAKDLKKLLAEAQKMDRLIELYENRGTTV